MNKATKKHDHRSAFNNGNHDFPPEAYEYHDDVTPAAVEIIRKRVQPKIAAEEWEVVDGIGFNINAA
ncbi:hypothetical protein [Rhizobium sp. YK2]|uniref:hypothetical protein n=1 Tax=Rhizobium sp. YK2 TaxID=1860096 RepID=UPI00084BD25D|nr:hypothetical protein [Rhizobium sp. YK2]OEC94395.1 hypothetical protein A9Z06_33350 [Rhizobium sp. YK2]